jgi:trehalose synthase
MPSLQRRRQDGQSGLESSKEDRGQCLGAYLPLIGEETVGRIALKAEALAGREVQLTNSTKQGGGVAEILQSLLPLMEGVGLQARWTGISGSTSFFTITKSIHNMLQGQEGDLSPEDRRHYEETVAANAALIGQQNDFVVVHDPQPLPLVRFRNGRGRWIWHCHLDLTTPNRAVRDYLLPMVEGYDAAVFSFPDYALPVHMPLHFMMPAIDPFTPKNLELSPEESLSRLRMYGIPDDRPIVAQVSRFDPWKDPLGVIEACRIARREVDFTLVLLGNMASDDPEGAEIFEQLMEYRDERTLVLADGDDPLLVSALQSRAAVVLQKSLREGFGLTVTEAMWKGRPVIGGKAGGITRQIEDGINGFLVSSVEEAAVRIVQLLRDPALGERLGQNARRTVAEKFLLTRLLEEYLDLLRETERGPVPWPGEVGGKR